MLSFVVVLNEQVLCVITVACAAEVGEFMS